MRAAIPIVGLLVLAAACGSRAPVTPRLDYDTESGGSLFPKDLAAEECTPAPNSCGALPLGLPWPRLHGSTEDAGWASMHLSDDSETALAIVAHTRDPAAIASTRAFAAKPSSARAMALFVLGVVVDAESIPLLVSALEDEDTRVRSTSAWSLGRMGQRASAADTALWSHAVGDRSFSARCAAANALSSIRRTRVDPVWRLAPDELYAIGTPLPDGVAAQVGRRFCTELAFEDDDLVLVGINKGELGGGVAYVPRAHTDAAPTAIDGAPADPLQFVRVAGEPWVISGLAHLSLSRAAVHRIRREASGQLVAERIVALRHIPIWYKVEDTTLILKTDDDRIHRIQAAY